MPSLLKLARTASGLLGLLWRAACHGTEIYRTLEMGRNRVPQTVRRTRVQNRRKPPAKTYRFDARLNEEQKLIIQRAADLEGRSMTDFVIHSAQQAAQRTIEDRAILVLSARDAEMVVDAILNPPDPGPVMRKAMAEYREKMGLK
jgi:uncharacterized protein (DUF1778 family)